MVKSFYMFYNSMVIALLLALVSFKSVWLEMRVNIGMLIPVYAALAYALLYAVLRKKGRISRRYKLFTVGNLVISGAVSALILGVSSFRVVPAAIIREGLGVRHVSFGSINIALCALLAAGLVIILMQKVDQ